MPESSWETDGELRAEVFDIIYTIDALDPQIQLQTAKKAKLTKVQWIGNYSRRRERPISIQFADRNAAEYFWENKGYLPDSLYVKKEYTGETEQNRRILRPVYNAAKKHPDYRGKCRMDGDCIVLRGIKYGTHNICDLPEELSGHKVTSRTGNNIIGFFGELNPMSNFHKCDFIVDNIRFGSTEQYIQYTKARYFENKDLAQRILAAKNAYECKMLAKEIVYIQDKKWSDKAKVLCYPGIKAKFKQNPSLCNFLIHTGDTTLVECSYDSLWGTGMPIHSTDCLKQECWVSQGLLRALLTKVHSVLSESMDISSSNQGTLV